MNWHAQSSEEVLKRLGSSERGLSEEEVRKRFAKYGKNMLREIKTKGRFAVFLGQFNSFLIWILISAALVSVLIGQVLDAIAIMAIVFVNAGIGFFQEYKAEEIIKKLRKRLRYKVLVLREGKQKEIDSKFLVPGDVVIFKSGDNVLADCRIISSENLQVNEAVLTGESFPVDKAKDILGNEIILAKRENMLYAGTNIVRGKVSAVVIETGKRTEFGKLAELVQVTKPEEVPLEQKVNSFSGRLGSITKTASITKNTVTKISSIVDIRNVFIRKYIVSENLSSLYPHLFSSQLFIV